MQKILFVTPNLKYTGSGKQLTELLLALPAERFQRRVCVVGRGGPWVHRLRQAGVEVDLPGSGRAFNPRPLWHLRRLVHDYRPDVVHAWRLPSLRWLALSGWKERLLVTPLFKAEDNRTWLRFLDRWLLQRAARVLALGATEVEQCRQWGVAEEKIAPLVPGIFSDALPPVAKIKEIPSNARVILCIGPLEQHKGFHEAIWALDILRYVQPNLHLVLAGQGSDQPRLEKFALSLVGPGFVHFVGPQERMQPLLRRAEMVWSPGRRETGVQSVLEAMAAGRPVVATHWPRLAELIREGETGFLIPPGEKVALARKAQVLLEDSTLRHSLGEAALRLVSEQFRADELARRCGQVYET